MPEHPLEELHSPHWQVPPPPEVVGIGLSNEIVVRRRSSPNNQSTEVVEASEGGIGGKYCKSIFNWADPRTQDIMKQIRASKDKDGKIRWYALYKFLR